MSTSFLEDVLDHTRAGSKPGSYGDATTTTLWGVQPLTLFNPALPSCNDVWQIALHACQRHTPGQGLVGENLLDVAIANDIDIEGACGGTLACSTCHLYIDEESFEK